MTGPGESAVPGVAGDPESAGGIGAFGRQKLRPDDTGNAPPDGVSYIEKN